MKVKLLVVFAICTMVGTYSLLTTAQSELGTVSGRVADLTSCSIIPGATVVLTNLKTGVAITRLTDTAGNYTFANVSPGIYALTFSLVGIQPSRLLDIRVDPGANLRFSPTLDLRAPFTGDHSSIQAGGVTSGGGVSRYRGQVRMMSGNLEIVADEVDLDVGRQQMDLRGHVSMSIPKSIYDRGQLVISIPLQECFQSY